MAPIRRYLRISKYSVLECRIFLENPADGPRWLLNPQDPALPRVFEAIRPLVLPKLREENERSKSKGKKKKSVKDVVTRDEFEVSIFLTEIGTRHSLLTKSKTFRDKSKRFGNADKLAGTDVEPVIIPEEEDETSLDLNDIPAEGEPPTKRVRRDTADDHENQEDDKKKLGFKTTYEGFSIWGWVLCLLVERKRGPGKKVAGPDPQALMAEWISTQQQKDDED